MPVVYPIMMNNNDFYSNHYIMHNYQTRPIRNINQEFPWLKNNALKYAMQALSEVEFSQEDVTYMNTMGVWLPFLSGNEAIDFIKKSNARIVFSELDGPDSHAQYDWDKNLIKINKKYENTENYAEILAISEAIMHEAGHALDDDGRCSVQEELDCLASNVLTHQYYKKLYPKIFENTNSQIINDGVDLYSKLYFDEDPQKKALVKRVKTKYGDLPLSDEKHPPSNLAKVIKFDRIA